MRSYFEKMQEFGQPLSERQLKTSAESVVEIEKVLAALKEKKE